jgi:hypothetical protein
VAAGARSCLQSGDELCAPFATGVLPRKPDDATAPVATVSSAGAAADVTLDVCGDAFTGTGAGVDRSPAAPPAASLRAMTGGGPAPVGAVVADTSSVLVAGSPGRVGVGSSAGVVTG